MGFSVSGGVPIDAILQSLLTTHGQVIYRESQKAAALDPNAGYGSNFLKSRGKGMDPIWDNVEETIYYMTGAKNRLVFLYMVVPEPSLSLGVTSRSDPPGRAATPGLTVPMPSLSAAAELV